MWPTPFEHVSPTFPLDARETIYDSYEAIAPTDSLHALWIAWRRVEASDTSLPPDFKAYLKQRAAIVGVTTGTPAAEPASEFVTLIDRFGLLYEAGTTLDAHNDPRQWSTVWAISVGSQITPTWPRDFRDTVNQTYEKFGSTRTIGGLRAAYRRLADPDANVPDDYAAYLQQRTPFRLSAYEAIAEDIPIDRRGWPIETRCIVDGMGVCEWIELSDYLGMHENRAHGGMSISEAIGYLVADGMEPDRLPKETWVRDLLAFDRICDPRCNRIINMLERVRSEGAEGFRMFSRDGAWPPLVHVFSEYINTIAIDQAAVKRGFTIRKQRASQST